MKPTSTIPSQASATEWSNLKHGTIGQFIDARVRATPGSSIEYNLEHFQAFARELAAAVTQIVMASENGFSSNTKSCMPVLKSDSRRAIDKYGLRLRHWQEAVLAPAELETFVTATFVWK
jgi:hypothetical protein